MCSWRRDCTSTAASPGECSWRHPAPPLPEPPTSYWGTAPGGSSTPDAIGPPPAPDGAPHLLAHLFDGIGGCRGRMQSGCTWAVTQWVAAAPVACWSPCHSSLSNPLYLLRMGSPAWPPQWSGWIHGPVGRAYGGGLVVGPPGMKQHLLHAGGGWAGC